MNNSEEYKKAVDQIHAPEDLKRITLEKMNKKKTYIIPFEFLSAVAVFLIIFAVGQRYFNKEKIVYINTTNNISSTSQEIKTAEANIDLPRFKDKEELLSILNNNQVFYEKGMISKSMSDNMTEAVNNFKADSEKNSSTVQDLTRSSNDFSITNNQVDSVDEADIVKTDGKNIFYVSNGIVNIIDANSLELLSEIRGFSTDDESFTPYQIFINANKIIVIGNYSKIKKITTQENDDEDVTHDYAYTNYTEMAKAMVYDLSNAREPKLLREVALDGYYKDARMIGDNVYLISNKGIRYYSDTLAKDEEILPIVCDSIATNSSKRIAYTDIAYFPGTTSYSYLLVGGFNINNNEPLSVETFFGAGDILYCSENNLYLTHSIYNDEYTRTNIIIYKFELDNSKVTMKCKGEVEGYINNQFSLDEFEGNLRVATTVITRPYEFDEETDKYIEEETTNRVYILDDNLEELSRIDNMANGEKIYAVRFIGRVGYVVTFEQIDPLFVLDLSDPRNPEIKGELKIPGYSSYLHPYDDTHIIGIGYNTRGNGYGGITNSNMKMSMFDISDLNNPVEMFNVDIGLDYVYSDILHDHKALFFKKSDDLIGFSYNTYERRANKSMWSFDIYHIDLEKGFEKFARFAQEHNYETNFIRMIYIGNTIYGLSETKVTAYDLNTQELLKELNLNKLDNKMYLYERDKLYIN